MHVWIKRDSLQLYEGEMMLTLDPPEEQELDDWLLLTTREVHYSQIADELERQARQYDKENDHRAARVAKDLALELRRQVYRPTTVN